ncbi:group II intron maturase-specific domain-containing protein [Streptomyces sp. NPDC127051]|uniref:group II intron maturase-specific domain-containing protein n=1 Tax=Streptomyces sp. NPDC127051 TaxID=3347119 RepID=UPI00365B0193
MSTAKCSARRRQQFSHRWACACRWRRRGPPRIDEGPDYLGWRIQRHRKRGTDRHYLYTYPAKKSVRAVAHKVKTACRTDVNQPLPVLLRQLIPMLRGWCAYFRPGVSSATFQYLRELAWRQVMIWIRRRHRRTTWKELRRRYCDGGWRPLTPTSEEAALFDPAKARTTRYRYPAFRVIRLV